MSAFVCTINIEYRIIYMYYIYHWTFVSMPLHSRAANGRRGWCRFLVCEADSPQWCQSWTQKEVAVTFH